MARKYQDNRCGMLFKAAVFIQIILLVLAISSFIYTFVSTNQIEREIQAKRDLDMFCVPCKSIPENGAQFETKIEDGLEVCCSKNAEETLTLFNMMLDPAKNKSCNEVFDKFQVEDQLSCNYPALSPKPKVISAHLWFNGYNLSGKGLIPVKAWHKTRDKLSHEVGVKVENGVIHILSSGLYHVYSQVYFHFLFGSQNNASIQEVFQHAILRYSPMLPGNGVHKLSHSNLTDCVNETRQFTDVTSYTASTTQLRAGDVVYVETSHISHIRRDEKSSFFGMHRVA